MPSTGLPGRVASAAVETAPVLAAGSTARLDPDAAARLQAKLNQAQAELEALGASRADELPEADPAVLERLPPEIQELYRARLGR